MKDIDLKALNGLVSEIQAGIDEGIGKFKAEYEAATGQKLPEPKAETVIIEGNESIYDSATNTINIHGSIGASIFEDGITVDKVATALAESKGEPVNVSIASGGGSVVQGAGIYSLLRSHEAPVSIRIDGYAYSAASVIALAGDTLPTIREGGSFAIHNSSTIMFGNKEAYLRMADRLARFDATMVSVYEANNSVMSRDEIIALMLEDTILTAEMAVERGFAVFADDADAEAATPVEGNPTAVNNLLARAMLFRL